MGIALGRNETIIDLAAGGASRNRTVPVYLQKMGQLGVGGMEYDVLGGNRANQGTDNESNHQDFHEQSLLWL
jgi:hypothetical protein